MMKQMKWPRPPFVLGVVLGEVVERYLFISIQRYGVEWFARPIVIVLFAIALLGLIRPLRQDIKAHGGLGRMMSGFGKPHFDASNLFNVFMICVIGAMMWEAKSWNMHAKIVPMIVGSLAMFFAAASLLNAIFRKSDEHVATGLAAQVEAGVQSKMHMDLESDTAHIDTRTIYMRAITFFGWLLAFMASMAVIGLIPTVPFFVIAFMIIEGKKDAKEKLSVIIPYAIILTIFIWWVFDYLLSIPWPQTYLGIWFPWFKFIPSV